MSPAATGTPCAESTRRGRRRNPTQSPAQPDALALFSAGTSPGDGRGRGRAPQHPTHPGGPLPLGDS